MKEKHASRSKRAVKLLIRVSISGALMAYLLSKTDIQGIIKQVKGVNWLLIVVAVPVINLVNILIRSLRLSIILRNLGFRTPLLWLSILQLKGLFLGSVLPGGISGDIYRTYKIAKETEVVNRSVTAIIVEKGFGFAMMVFTCFIGLLIGIFWVAHPVFLQMMRLFSWVFLLIFSTIIACIIILHTNILEKIAVPPKPIAKIMENLGNIKGIFNNTVDIIKIALLSLMLQMNIVVWYFVIAKAISSGISFLTFMVTVPLVEFLIMLPISIGGIGVREGAFVLVLSPFGLSGTDAISFSLLSSMVYITIRIFAGTAFFFETGKKNIIVRTEVIKNDV